MLRYYHAEANDCDCAKTGPKEISNPVDVAGAPWYTSAATEIGSTYVFPDRARWIASHRAHFKEWGDFPGTSYEKLFGIAEIVSFVCGPSTAIAYYFGESAESCGWPMKVTASEPCEATWWLAIRRTIAKPWPREAVLMDLRFWRGQEIATAHRPKADRIERPGRPALAATWGWTEWQVRTVVKSESEWFKQ